jgi:hypothetical protein
MKTINKKCNKLVLISWSNKGSKWEHCGDKITGKEEIALCYGCENGNK